MRRAEMRRAGHQVRVGGVLAACLLWHCSGVAPDPESPFELSLSAERKIEAYTDQVMQRATEAELWITPALEFLTSRRSGELVDLEYRLKARDSVVRKLRAALIEAPETPVSRIPIQDAVRYTIVIDDAPPGHHDRSVHEILEIMEGVGHEVIEVKNYWPPGDDYSGINAILTAPNGTFWELQFHTPESLQAKNSVHSMYEVYRLASTPLEERQQLFAAMTRVWDEVTIPVNVLTPGSVHAVEEIKFRSPP